MRNTLFIIFILIGIILMTAAGSVHTGSIRENGRIGLDMFLKGLLFLGIAFIILILFRSKKN
jgi:hypothetical protein